MSIFIGILIVLWSGMALGILYAKIFHVQPVKTRLRLLRRSMLEEKSIKDGQIRVRCQEYPLDAEEYIRHTFPNGVKATEFNEEKLRKHLDQFAVHITSRQKRDFVTMLKSIKNPQIIIEKIVK